MAGCFKVINISLIAVKCVYVSEHVDRKESKVNNVVVVVCF